MQEVRGSWNKGPYIQESDRKIDNPEKAVWAGSNPLQSTLVELYIDISVKDWLLYRI